MAPNKKPADWSLAGGKLSEFLKSRNMTQGQLSAMLSKYTGVTRNTSDANLSGIVRGHSMASAWWVLTSAVLGVDLRYFSGDPDWIRACRNAYDAWISTSEIGQKANRHMTMQTIWTNKLTGEQIDPATATQAKEDQPMKAPAIQNKPTFPAGVLPAPSIVDLAAQFEVAQKRLVAAAAEHKAAQDALETLRAQLAAAIKP